MTTTTTIESPYRERLEAWRDFLRTDEVAKHWNYTLYADDEHEPGPNCQTNACAAGWLSRIFPDDWVWVSKGEQPALRSDVDVERYRSITCQIAEYFGITESDASGLTVYLDDVLGISRDDVRPRDVADAIDRLLRGEEL